MQTTVRLLGYIPIHELDDLTVHEWELYVKGARHRRLDMLEDMRLQSIMQARLTNGKDIKAITKHIDRDRKLIDQTESSIEHDKEKDKWLKREVAKVQRRALQRWLDAKNEERSE
ncbi:MAG: hypothetical protein Q4F01_05810 [Staphylococcus rostri]|uniref:hypothetical protein n=1 Tax=Staphylococcus rostri TaxID=522262 RepID=UPI0026DF273B|nr:hypothetical protein [Staphylococcus rostri]MDO5375689.1 hypothetical protein [Staphylococcus rostri]